MIKNRASVLRYGFICGVAESFYAICAWKSIISVPAKFTLPPR